MIFGLLYVGTVAQFPKAIFVTAAGVLLFALVSMFLVVNPAVKRVRVGKGKKVVRRIDEELERGRSRASKDLFGGTSGNVDGI